MRLKFWNLITFVKQKLLLKLEKVKPVSLLEADFYNAKLEFSAHTILCKNFPHITCAKSVPTLDQNSQD